MRYAKQAILLAVLCLAAGSGQGASPGPQPLPAAAPITAPVDRPYPGEVRLVIDATDLDRRIVHVTETLSGVKTGTTLLYPKWLPANHSTTGPIDRFAGLVVTTNGVTVPWTRDPIDMYAFHLDLPTGVHTIELAFDYLSPTSGRVDPVEMSHELMMLDPINLLLYPAGYYTRRIPVTASLRLPEGWQYATALEPDGSDAKGTTFKRTTIEMLADSPVYAGRYAKQFDLDPGAAVRVTLNVFADRPELLAATPAQVAAHRALVQQAYRLYGSHHYAHYDFLYALSDQISGRGTEHHQSSENTSPPTIFTEWDKTAGDRDLLAHEYAHSWNGKFLRPADLWTPNYDVPMRDSLLWVYEGQTEFWGYVLAARSGLMTREQVLDQFAMFAAHYARQAGRAWRSLKDTTNQPIINHHRPRQWSDWTRARDYYTEGLLIWLDVDTLIRERSIGRRSLDDFARAFFGIEDGSLNVVTYTFDDVVRALNAIEPYDWAAFLRQRVDTIHAEAPLDGIRRGGYRLVYTEAPSAAQKADEAQAKQLDLMDSIGFVINNSDGTIATTAWGSPAFKAGLMESTQLVSVNGVAYDADLLREAIQAAKTDPAPIVLIVRAGNRYRTVNVEYTGGLRYPHLERDGTTPARLDDLLTARRP
jgi:predicted metalloprotease with PDZ domain